jgi:hypothetical protein
MSTRRYILLFIFYLGILSLGTATEAVTQFEDNMSFSYEHRTEGTGFFSAYRHVTAHTEPVLDGMAPVNDKEYLIGKTGKIDESSFTAGSGQIDNEGLLEAQKSSVHSRDYMFVETRENGSSSISGSDDNSMTYTPETIAIGTGFYNVNPIKYLSQLREDN